MDEHLIVDYIDKIVKPAFTNKSKQLLIMDDYTAHKTSLVFEKLATEQIKAKILPPGFNSYIQPLPLDVALNKPFEERYREKWTN